MIGTRTTPGSIRRTGANSRRRGSAYVLFLGTAFLVTIIGLSALTVIRVKLRAASDFNDSIAARVHAESAVEHGRLALNADANWRSAIVHDEWTPLQSLGNGAFAWKLVDEVHDNLETDPSAPVRVYGKGVYGDAVRVYSALVQPPLSALPDDTLVNGDLETGPVSPWWDKGDCSLQVHSDDPHGGTSYLLVTGRTDEQAGPFQSLPFPIQAGLVYESGVWIKMRSASEDVRFGLWIRSDSGWTFFELNTAPIDTTWTRLSGTVTPTWTGALIDAAIAIETTTSNQEFMIDDATFRRVPAALGPIPGTWRRESE